MDSGGATHRQSPFFASFYLPDFLVTSRGSLRAAPCDGRGELFKGFVASGRGFSRHISPLFCGTLGTGTDICHVPADWRVCAGGARNDTANFQTDF